MNSKAYLLQIRKLDTLINNKLAEVDHWKEVACGTSAYSEGERVQTSGNKHKMASAIEKYIDIQKEIDAAIDRLVDMKQEVIRTIEVLPTAEYDVLHKYYVQGMDFYQIADAMDKSYSWATSVHGRALAHLQRVLDERNIHDGI
jgi:DNA-directed RNA polymerase specialized sigma24 family protein